MKRSSIDGLRNVVWVDPMGDQSLELGVVPAKAGLVVGYYSSRGNKKARAIQICREAFVNFRGFIEEDGTVIENSEKERLWLWANCPIVEPAVVQELLNVGDRLKEGEEDAVSE